MQELRERAERLHDATEELRQQNERLLAAQRALEGVRARYRELFDFAPDAWLLTDADGTILVIEQAKRVLAERYAIGVDDAFELLRRASRKHRMRIHGLAAAVLASRETPVEIPPPDTA